MRFRLAVACLVAAPQAFAQEVTLSGINTLRLERYETRGAVAGSPFPITTTTGYDELVLNFAWRPSAFDHWRVLFAGVVNDSPYRSPARGFVLERLLVARESGQAAIPYRAEAGDIFAFTTLRTQQRPLKGVAVELQPVLGHSNLRTSIFLFGGASSAQPNWRDLRWSDDNTVGVSWLTEIAAARFTVNALRNERAANAATNTLDRRQTVASLAAEVPFRLGASQWRAEAEGAALRGDHDGVPPSNDGQDRRDSGLFAQLSGSLTGAPLSWRLRAERYGQDYRPFGTAIPFDRRSAEAHVSWQSAGALMWRARVQDFRDDLESGNPLDTLVIGAGVSGPWSTLGATIGVDVFQQELDRADGSVDQRNLTANAFLSRPIGKMSGQLGLLYQSVDDRLLPEASPRTRQVSLSLVAPFQWGRLNGSIAPGVLWRDISGAPFATRDTQANLQLMLFGGPHRLSLSAGRLAQGPTLSTSPDVATVNFGLDYRFRWRRHELGLDVTVFDREPRPGEKTEAYRAGLSWTFSFDRSPPQVAASQLAAVPVATATGPVPGDAGLFAVIGPGDDLEATLARLSVSGFAGAIRMPGAVVYEARVLPDVDERQRIAIAHSAGRVERLALIVSLAETGGADNAARTHERIRRALIERYGRPSATFEDGTFGPAFARDVAAGRLIRVSEWTTDRGTLRLGIPRRLDGVARIEIHHARSFPSARDTAWGLDAVR